jgi:hypothetical protein
MCVFVRRFKILTLLKPENIAAQLLKNYRDQHVTCAVARSDAAASIEASADWARQRGYAPAHRRFLTPTSASDFASRDAQAAGVNDLAVTITRAAR